MVFVHFFINYSLILSIYIFIYYIYFINFILFLTHIFASFKYCLFFVSVQLCASSYLSETHTILQAWDTLRMLNRITQFSNDVL